MTLRTSSSRREPERSRSWDTQRERPPAASGGAAPAASSARQLIVANLRSVAMALLAVLLIRVCLFEAFEIDGPSMEPSLLSGERVVVAKYAFGLFLPLRDHAELNWASPVPGDVVVLKSPADGVAIIKRVIGVAGDTVEVRNDVVYRNGLALPRIDRGRCVSGIGAVLGSCRVLESEVGGHSFLTSSAGRGFEGPRVTVPPGHVYVLGDHRDMSNDSRNPAIGAVPLNRLKGKGLAIHWSLGDHGLRFDRMFHAVR